MTFLILSYRQGYILRHEATGNESSLDFAVAEDVEGVACYVARRIKEDPRADYHHAIVRNWDDALGLSHAGLSLCGAEDSVVLHGPYDYDNEDLEHGQARESLQDHIRDLVAQLLGESSQAHKRQVEQEHRARAEAEQRRRNEEAEVKWRAEAPARAARELAALKALEAKEKAELARLRRKYPQTE